MIMFGQFLFLILTYLISAIPFGLLFSLFFSKTDIRQYGSKNIGATNVSRVLGKKLGLLTLIFDALKGALMVISAKLLFVKANQLHFYLILVGSVAILAHIFPIYLNFKGGKGVATSLAVLVALDFPIGLLAICFWILAYLIFRISSVSSLVAVFSSALSCLVYNTPTSQIIFSWLLFFLIFYRHKDNLVRLAKGTESS